MAAMRMAKKTAVLASMLGMVGSALAGEVMVVNWSGTLDVPDNDEYATSYVVSSAPSGAIVTGLSYQTLVDDRGVAASFSILGKDWLWEGMWRTE